MVVRLLLFAIVFQGAANALTSCEYANEHSGCRDSAKSCLLTHACTMKNICLRNGNASKCSNKKSANGSGYVRRYLIASASGDPRVKKTLTVSHSYEGCPSNMTEHGILAYIFCEANLWHFITETLWPIWRTISQTPQSVYTVVLQGSTWSNHTDACHGPRYASLFRLVPKIRSPILWMSPDVAYDFHSGRRVVHGDFECFRDFALYTPASRRSAPPATRLEFSKAIAAHAGHKPNSWFTRLVWSFRRVLILDRRSSRGITNVELLRRELARHLGHAYRVDVTQFEEMPVREQMTHAINAHFMIGVHGAGMTWSLFLNGGRPDQAALIELFPKGWKRCHFTIYWKRANWLAECQEHSSTSTSLANPKNGHVTASVRKVVNGFDSLLQGLRVRSQIG